MHQVRVLLQMVFFALSHIGESFPDVARIKTNRMGDSWRATVPLSVSGVLSVQKEEQKCT